jgi:hypothetical protein
LKRATATTLVTTIIILGLFVLSGIYAFHGSPFTPPHIVHNYDRPEWSRDLAVPTTYPAYRLKPDGTSVPIGRLLLTGPNQVELRVFADIEGVESTRGRVAMIETNIKSLWALVPNDSKAEILSSVETMVGRMRRHFLDIIGSQAFAEDYRDRLQAALTRSYDQTWRDPRVRVAMSAVSESFASQIEGGELTDAVLPIFLSRLQSGLVRALGETWNTISGGGTQPSPTMLEGAISETLADPQVREVILAQAMRVAGRRENWGFTALFINALVDQLSEDKGLERLLDELFSDPRFADPLRQMEEDTAAMSTNTFYRVVGRSGAKQPDPLAVRILRYVLLNRRRLVGLYITPEQIAGKFSGLARYDALVATKD